MAVIYRGATLTPHFREFLPPWVARQTWYSGAEVPPLRLIGAFRLEDPAGQVGIETQLLSDGAAIYQVPMTYRGAPLPRTLAGEKRVAGACSGEAGGVDPRLIATAEHSVLGTRWIYDAEQDPVWAEQVLRLIRVNGRADPSVRKDAGVTTARGQRLAGRDLTADQVEIEICRLVTPLVPARQEGLAGLVIGTWQPSGPDGPTEEGCLALARDRGR
ncbi:MAG: maltokinase N-terminal cap-like domain-containing protein [Streptosporangiaceae bacterium]